MRDRNTNSNQNNNSNARQPRRRRHTVQQQQLLLREDVPSAESLASDPTINSSLSLAAAASSSSPSSSFERRAQPRTSDVGKRGRRQGPGAMEAAAVAGGTAAGRGSAAALPAPPVRTSSYYHQLTARSLDQQRNSTGPVAAADAAASGGSDGGEGGSSGSQQQQHQQRLTVEFVEERAAAVAAQAGRVRRQQLQQLFQHHRQSPPPSPSQQPTTPSAAWAEEESVTAVSVETIRGLADVAVRKGRAGRSGSSSSSGASGVSYGGRAAPAAAGAGKRRTTFAGIGWGVGRGGGAERSSSSSSSRGGGAVAGETTTRRRREDDDDYDDYDQQHQQQHQQQHRIPFSFALASLAPSPLAMSSATAAAGTGGGGNRRTTPSSWWFGGSFSLAASAAAAAADFSSPSAYAFPLSSSSAAAGRAPSSSSSFSSSSSRYLSSSASFPSSPDRLPSPPSMTRSGAHLPRTYPARKTSLPPDLIPLYTRIRKQLNADPRYHPPRTPSTISVIKSAVMNRSPSGSMQSSPVTSPSSTTMSPPASPPRPSPARSRTLSLTGDEFYGADFSNPASSTVPTAALKSPKASRTPDAKSAISMSADSLEELRLINMQRDRNGSAAKGRLFISALNRSKSNFSVTDDDRTRKRRDSGGAKGDDSDSESESDRSEFETEDGYLDDDASSSGAEESRRQRRRRRRLKQSLWIWIGSAAEMDKRFCCAMYAVGLRNWMGASGKIIRESDSEETKDFLALFGGSVEHEDASMAAESGLYIVEEKTYPLRVYRIHGKPNAKLTLVEPKALSLTSDHVYLVDGGMEIFLWNGNDAGLANRSHARIIADSINTTERVGRAIVVEIDEGKEPDRFWDLLGGERDFTPSHFNPDNEFEQLAARPPKLYRIPADIVDFDGLKIEHYLVTSGGAPGFKRGSKLADGPVPLSRSMLQPNTCSVVDAGVEVYMWLGSKSSADCKDAATVLLARVVRLDVRRPPWLALRREAEGEESEVFKMRFADWKPATAAPNNPPPIVPPKVDVGALYAPHPLSRMYEGARQASTPVAATSSSRTTAPSLSTIDLTTTTALLPGVGAVAAGSSGNIAAAVASPTPANGPAGLDLSVVHAAAVKAALAVAQSMLVAPVMAFVFDRGGQGSERKFTRLESWEEGHLCSGDAYVFLAVYRKRRIAEEEAEHSLDDVTVPAEADGARQSATAAPLAGVTNSSSFGSVTSSTSSVSTTTSSNSSSTRSSISDVPSFSTDRKKDLECVVYFWIGRRASKLALSTFKFHSQAEIEALVQSMYACSIRVVVVEEGREPLALLAHLKNRVIVHRGGRAGFAERVKHGGSKPLPVGVAQDAAEGTKALVYHVRSDLRFMTTRAMEIAPKSGALVSRDCFFVLPVPVDGKGKDEPAGYLWVGRNAAREEARKAGEIARRIVEVFDPAVLAADPAGSNHTMVSSRVFRLVPEDSEPDSFWALLDGGKVPHPVGPLPSYTFVGGTPVLSAAAAPILPHVPHYRRSSLTLPLDEPLPAWTSASSTLPRSSAPSPLPASSSTASLRGSLPSSPIFPQNSFSFLSSSSSSSLSSSASLVSSSPPAPANHFPRLLICSCTKGYFSVEEQPFFIQTDLRPEACALVDAGPTPPPPHTSKSASPASNSSSSISPVRVWCGRLASDVVRKLTKKAVQVWLDVMDDGRRGKPEAVEWIEEGRESAEFKALFHGWDDEVGGGGGTGDGRSRAKLVSSVGGAGMSGGPRNGVKA
ncbi:hypothetical protein DFJ73DRAFT_915603 [Zopfochytrium polystomum]|nr:hypothetical protein DFJ73DRAFT_915603 [Zopfochytrium polystomum]